MKKILIVDDNVSFTEFLDATVRAAGHETRVVHNGAEALDVWEETHPDLVFLDVLLPKVDGFKVCQQIRSRENGSGPTPIVMMTGIYTKRAYQRDAVSRYGANDYLVKPFAITDIWQVLERQLGSVCTTVPHTPCGNAADVLLQDSGGEAFGGVSLRDRPLALVLSELKREQRTGLLFLKGEVATDVFFIEQGELAFVRSSDISQRLDKVLERSGILTAEQVEEGRRLLVESRGQSRMGQILVSLGHLTEKQLEETVQSQLRRRIHAAFQNEDLGFTFVDGPLPEDEDIRVHLDMANVILEGLRTMTDSSSLVRHLPPPEAALHRGATDTTGLHLTGYEKQVIDLANGRTTVGQALAIGRLAEVDVTRTLFSLVCLEIVKPGEPREDVAHDEEVPEREKATREKRPFPLPPRGDLRVLPPARVLAALHRSARTGILELRGKDGLRSIYVDRGDVVFAQSDDPADRLGEILVDGGLLSVEDRNRVADMQSEQSGKRMGQILVEEGLLGLEELRWAVVFQVQKIISASMARTEGRYTFREGPLPTRETITVDLKTPDLLMEGLRRVASRIAKRHLPDETANLRPAADTESRIAQTRLTAQELDVLRAIGAGASIEDLRRRRIAEDGFLSVCLHTFLAMGLIEKGEGGARAVAAGAQMLEDIASEAESAAERVESAPKPPKPVAGPVTETVEGAIVIDDGPEPRPAPQTDESESGRVPRFLYDQLLQEREELEAQLYSAHSRLKGARAAVLEARRIVENFRDNIHRRGAPVEIPRLDPILEEIVEICRRSVEHIGDPGSEQAAEES